MSEGTAKQNAENHVNTRVSGNKVGEYGLKSRSSRAAVLEALTAYGTSTRSGGCFFLVEGIEQRRQKDAEGRPRAQRAVSCKDREFLLY